MEHISRKRTAVPIGWFPVPEESEYARGEGEPGQEREEHQNQQDHAQCSIRALQNGAGKIGFVPKVFRDFGFRPERLRTWFAHYKQLREPTPSFDAAEREIIAVAVSMANGCPASSPTAPARGSGRPDIGR